MKLLYQIRHDIALRAEQIVSMRGEWPCRKGCADCCRQLASEPRVSEEEWQHLSAAIKNLSAGTAETVKQRICKTAGAARPVTCPLLDSASGNCLVYEARPVACRAYGFYAERDEVLGCRQIEQISQQSGDIIWGNHAALEGRLLQLGPAMELSKWLQVGDG